MSEQKAWIVYHGGEFGGREDCSIFYAPTEVYLSLQEAKDRKAQIELLHRASDLSHMLYVHIESITIGKQINPSCYMSED